MSDYEQVSIDVSASFHIDATPLPSLESGAASKRPVDDSEIAIGGALEQADLMPRSEAAPAVEGALLVPDLVAWPSAGEETQESPSPTTESDSDAAELVGEHNTANLDEAELPVPPAEGSKPVWEVDRLRWPELCNQLLEEEDEYFQHAGQKLYEASRQGLKVLAVTAAQRGEGCTTLAACLARAVAGTGARVALIDADVQNPQLSKALGLELPAGWPDAASRTTPWVETAIVSSDPDLTVIPGHQRHGTLSSMTASDAPAVLKEIADHFDLIVLDVGPLATHARYLWDDEGDSVVDAAIVVRDCRQTTEATTMGITAKLRALGVHAVGIAENYASPRSAAAAA